MKKQILFPDKFIDFPTPSHSQKLLNIGLFHVSLGCKFI